MRLGLSRRLEVGAHAVALLALHAAPRRPRAFGLLACAFLAGCPGAQGLEEEERSLSALTDRALGVSFGSDDSAYGLTATLSYAHASDECFTLPSAAYAEVDGHLLEEHGGYWGKGDVCVDPWFSGSGLALPVGGGDGTVRIVDGAFEASVTIERLFDVRTAALRAPATGLTTGAKVYLDLAPAADDVTAITVAYYPDGGPVDASGYPIPAFQLDSNQTDPALDVLRDAGGWYFFVPAVPAGSGRVDVVTYCWLNVLATANLARAEADGTFVRQFTTTSTP